LASRTFNVLEKTRIGKYFRTTVPQEVRSILNLEEGDDIIWIQEENRISVDRARKEVA